MTVQPDHDYHAYLVGGRFMVPSDEAGKAFYPPRATVPGTGSENVQWIEASGRGVIYSFTTIHRKPPEANYNVSLIDLAEGPRMMSRVEDIDPAAVKIGMRVSARIVNPEQGSPFVVFVPEQRS